MSRPHGREVIHSHGLEIQIVRDRDGYIDIIIYTEELPEENEHRGGDRIPKLRVLVNEEDEGIRINSNGKWVGENIAPPLEQLAESAE